MLMKTKIPKFFFLTGVPKNCATSPENCCWDWKREEGQTTHLCPNMGNITNRWYTN